ncbi:hypothetical protein IT411_01875 [Candidatus Peregrinibacteria bacterium]|nr:hypothetical protein [Candidatus Peregrinibacteria bacterium]
MKNTFGKKLILATSIISLLINASPLFAQVLSLEILGGGYKLRGPSEINFTSLSSSTSSNTNQLSFADVGNTTPGQAENNFLKVIDENGGNPFDVIVSATDIKRSELLETSVTTGSTTTEIKVTSTTGLFPGDNFQVVDVDSTIYTIASIPDTETIISTTPLSSIPSPGAIIRRVVDCQLNNRKCIPLTNFSIKNSDNSHVPSFDTVNGNSADFHLNIQTEQLTPFKGQATTIAGSSGNNLKLDNINNFQSGEEIVFPADSGVVPLTNNISRIIDSETVQLTTSMDTPPGAGVTVTSANSRTLTLGNGDGAAPGEWNLQPFLQTIIPAGQLSGVYEMTLNFTIV